MISRQVQPQIGSSDAAPSDSDMSDGQAWQGPIYGEFGFLAEEGDRLQCHICGKWYRSLAAHVFQRHELTAHGYRAAFGLAVTTALVGPSLRAVRRATGIRILQQYNHMREYFARLSSEERSAAAKGREVRPETRRRMAAAKRRHINVVCAVCGETFGIKASWVRKPERHTCSPTCRRALRRQDAQREAHRRIAGKNLAQGNTVRWEKTKAATSARLQTLDPSAFVVLTDHDQLIIRAYYGLDGGGRVTQRELARRYCLTYDQVRGRLTRGMALLLEPNVRD